jgi:Ca-activated chloride channel homolog
VSAALRVGLVSAGLHLLLASIVLAWPQADPPGGDDPGTITVDVRRVALYVTVREGRAGFVGDLQRDHFTVKEDGEAQKILEFSRDDVPVAVGLVVDNSQSMMNKHQEVAAAAKAFIAASNPQDEMFVVHFNEKVVLGLPEDVPFSSDHGQLGRALDALQADGKTALYDGIHLALHHLERSTLTKKALIVISDGGDNASSRRMRDVVRASGLSGALFYAVGIYDALDGDANPGVLRRLANQTGGEAFFPERVSEISPLCESIARDLRNQYTLVYSPPARPGDIDFHKIRVTVKDPMSRSLKIRHRDGYYGEGVGIQQERGTL